MSFKSDQYLICNMTAAMLDVCKRLRPENDNQQARIRIADAMIASAKLGNHSQTDFFDAGMTVVMKIEKRRSTWFGLRRPSVTPIRLH